MLMYKSAILCICLRVAHGSLTVGGIPCILLGMRASSIWNALNATWQFQYYTCSSHFVHPAIRGDDVQLCQFVYIVQVAYGCIAGGGVMYLLVAS